MSTLSMGFSPEGKFKKRLTHKIHNGLRCYEIIDGEITGMSIVTSPAHSVNVAIISEEKRTIGGPALIPDKMIYRIDPISGEEHYIFFTAEVIEKMASKYKLEISWTNDELSKLALMFSDCKTEKEISLSLNKTEEEVTRKIKSLGESFRNMVFILMLYKNKTNEEIEKALNISESEIPNLVTKLGGKITPQSK